MPMLSNKQAVGLVVIAGLGLWYLRKKAGDALQAVNPLNNENVIYQSVKDTPVTGTLDHVFATVDLMNPWASDSRKAYAKKVWSGD